MLVNNIKTECSFFSLFFPPWCWRWGGGGGGFFAWSRWNLVWLLECSKWHHTFFLVTFALYIIYLYVIYIIYTSIWWKHAILTCKILWVCFDNMCSTWRNHLGSLPNGCFHQCGLTCTAAWGMPPTWCGVKEVALREITVCHWQCLVPSWRSTGLFHPSSLVPGTWNGCVAWDWFLHVSACMCAHMCMCAYVCVCVCVCVCLHVCTCAHECVHVCVCVWGGGGCWWVLLVDLFPFYFCSVQLLSVKGSCGWPFYHCAFWFLDGTSILFLVLILFSSWNQHFWICLRKCLSFWWQIHSMNPLHELTPRELNSDLTWEVLFHAGSLNAFGLFPREVKNWLISI